jgi:hypothetical protein
MLGGAEVVEVRIRGYTIGLGALLAVAVLMAGAPAEAATTGYSGRFAQGGELSFNLKKERGERKVTRWRWTDFPVVCASGAETTEGHYTFWLEVKRREFAGRAVLESPSGRTIGGAKVEGRFRHGYQTAGGSFRVYGRTPEDHRHCDSGKVDWTAAEEVTTPPPVGPNVPQARL